MLIVYTLHLILYYVWTDGRVRRVRQHAASRLVYGHPAGTRHYNKIFINEVGVYIVEITHLLKEWVYILFVIKHLLTAGSIS